MALAAAMKLLSRILAICNRRLRLELLRVSKWLLKPERNFTFPLPVNSSRLAAALRVRILGTVVCSPFRAGLPVFRHNNPRAARSPWVNERDTI